MSYAAIISRVRNVRKHPNADRLNLASVVGNTVVVGLDVQEGQMGIYFPDDGQISEAFAAANDLIRRKDPVTGEQKGGLFDENRKVRTQRLRGEKSEGYWTSLESLAFTGCDLASLKEGDQVTVLNGVEICRKYETIATLKARAKQGAGKSNKGKAKKIFTLPMHFDTERLAYYINTIPVGALCSISLKLHGTSARYGHILVEEPLAYKWYQRLGAKLFRISLPEKKQYWDHVIGSRRMIIELSDEQKSGDWTYNHGDAKFRDAALGPLKGNLRKGEVIFFEIVGFQRPGVPLFGGYDNSKTKDKEFIRTYGKVTNFTYGCSDGEHKCFIYRIAMTNPDGQLVDLPWEQVKQRAAELGMPTVPEIIPQFFYTGDAEALMKLVEKHVSGPDLIDPTHIREGVCLRVETERGVKCFKEKSFEFRVLEGLAKADDNFVDTEEVA